jgi:hypothetical protein
MSVAEKTLLKTNRMSKIEPGAAPRPGWLSAAVERGEAAAGAMWYVR